MGKGREGVEEAGEGGEGALCVSLSLRGRALGTCISLHRLGGQEVGGRGARRKDANINILLPLFVCSFVCCQFCFKITIACS